MLLTPVLISYGLGTVGLLQKIPVSISSTYRLSILRSPTPKIWAGIWAIRLRSRSWGKWARWQEAT